MSNAFFGKEGITSTSANYYANIAKELVQADIKKLEELKFVSTAMSSIVSNNRYIITEGTNDITWIQKSLERISDMNTLCAWLREAIKAKDDMLKNLPTFETWLKKEHPDIELKRPELPKNPIPIFEEDIFNSWNTDKRLHFLEIEAKAATFGKYIHPNGSINRAREEAHKVLNNPTSVDGTGREALIYNKSVSLPIEEIDNKFMDLQSNYRTFEKELNYLKAEIKEEVNKQNAYNLKLYQEQMNEYNKKSDELYSLNVTLNNEYNIWLVEKKEYISKLKIVIPNNLNSIYQLVASK